MRSLTLVAAVSVRVITEGASCGDRDELGPGYRRAVAISTWHGRAIGKIVERHHLAVASGVDEALHQAPVEAAHEVGVGLGQLSERTAGERDGGAVVVDHRLRVEAEGGELLGERLGAGAGAAGGGGGALLAPGLDGVGGRHVGAGGQAEEHPGQHGERRRLEAEGRGIGGERVAVLRTADGALGVGDHVEEAHLAHPIEVRAHGVGVEPERVGDLGGGQRGGRAGELEVDRVAGVVAERLQQLEPRRGDLGVVGHAPWSLHGCAPVESGSCRPPRSPPRTTSWRCSVG